VSTFEVLAILAALAYGIFGIWQALRAHQHAQALSASASTPACRPSSTRWPTA
jgi:hypothetical protein